jgi:hypothetical protein
VGTGGLVAGVSCGVGPVWSRCRVGLYITWNVFDQ